MIEFKRDGDVMVFECPSFKVEVVADSERIVVNPDRHIAGSGEMMQLLTDAFKILDMMIEHKNKRDGNKKVTDMNLKINVDAKDEEEVIERLNDYIWKSESGNNPPGHRFRECMKRRGL